MRKALKIIALVFAALVVTGGIVVAVIFAGLPKDTTVVTDPDVYSLDSSSLTLDLSKVSELSAVWSSVAIKNDVKELYIIIVKTAEGEFVVASKQCTHGERQLIFDPDEKILKCTSLGQSAFNLDGSVIKGLAKNPLKIYNYSLDEDYLIIDLLS